MVQDIDAKRTPQWSSAKEEAVATDECIFIACQADVDGDVAMRVERGEPPPAMHLAFEGFLCIQTPEIEVGNILDGDVRRVNVGAPGEHHVRIFVEPLEHPDKVVILLDA